VGCRQGLAMPRDEPWKVLHRIATGTIKKQKSRERVCMKHWPSKDVKSKKAKGSWLLTVVELSCRHKRHSSTR
jgi:hypothetical protein